MPEIGDIWVGEGAAPAQEPQPDNRARGMKIKKIVWDDHFNEEFIGGGNWRELHDEAARVRRGYILAPQVAPEIPGVGVNLARVDVEMPEDNAKPWKGVGNFFQDGLDEKNKPKEGELLKLQEKNHILKKKLEARQDEIRYLVDQRTNLRNEQLEMAKRFTELQSEIEMLKRANNLLREEENN